MFLKCMLILLVAVLPVVISVLIIEKDRLK